jgi:uncharacterized membrane protein
VHPILVTVPIGAWVASLGFDISSHVADEADVFAKGAFWLIALGVLRALVAALAGYLDRSRSRPAPPPSAPDSI